MVFIFISLTHQYFIDTIMIRKLQVLFKRYTRPICYAVFLVFVGIALLHYVDYFMDTRLYQPKYVKSDISGTNTKLASNFVVANNNLSRKVITGRDNNNRSTEKTVAPSKTSRNKDTLSGTSDKIISSETDRKILHDEVANVVGTDKSLLSLYTDSPGALIAPKNEKLKPDSPNFDENSAEAKNESSVQQVVRDAASKMTSTASSKNVENSEETEEEFMERMEKRMKARRKATRDACDRLLLNSEHKVYQPWELTVPIPRPWTFLSKNYSLLYCEIPKSGCSNWKKVLMVLNGLSKNTDIPQGKAHAAGIGLVNYNPTKEDRKIYENSTKLLMVREPFERLVSAYLDKVAEKPPTHKALFPRFSSEVAKKYGVRWNDPTRRLKYGLREITTCASHESELFCDNPHEVIKVSMAIYGREDNVTCGEDPKWKGNTCMAEQAYFVLTQLCNGKKICRVVASEAQFGKPSACPQLSKYLSVSYQCIPTENMETVVVCHPDVHTLKCPPGGVLSIGTAFYGRTNRQTCSFRARMLNLECDAETATSAVYAACNHKESCSVQATPEWIQSDPCPATNKYLQIWYTCIDARTIPKRLQTSKNTVNINASKSDAVLQTGPDLADKTTIPIPEIYKRPDYVSRVYDIHATFDEFASYLLDPFNADVSKDVIDHGSPAMKSTSVRHWQSYSTLCYPCHIEYDVIAHMETIAEDARYLLKRIGAPPNLTYPGGYDQTGMSSTKVADVKKLFSSLSKDTAMKLYNLYKIDFELFGYKPPEAFINSGDVR